VAGVGAEVGIMVVEVLAVIPRKQQYHLMEILLVVKVFQKTLTSIKITINIQIQMDF